jgi:hypothetical protein
VSCLALGNLSLESYFPIQFCLGVGAFFITFKMNHEKINWQQQPKKIKGFRFNQQFCLTT